MKQKKFLKSLALFGASALVLSGCATGEDSGAFKACAVSDEGSWNDKSFNESVYDGLVQAEDELGVEIYALESVSVDDIKPNLQAMVDSSCDLIVGVGFNSDVPVDELAAANPDLNFVAVDGSNFGELANKKPINYNMEESSYLVGYAAAEVSESKILGTFGGEKFGTVTVFMDGFVNGAKAWGADNGVEVTVLGWDPATQEGDFAGDGTGAGFAPNNANSKAIALTQANAGADFIFPVGGDQFGATLEAFKELGIDGKMAGVDKDIALTSPEYADFIVTSAEKRMTNAIFDIIKDLTEGKAFSADAYIGTLANGGTGISPFYDFDSQISEETKTRLAEIEAGIISGEISAKG